VNLCDRCKQEIARADRRVRTLSVSCPACGAEAGRPCIGRWGQEIMGTHADRNIKYQATKRER